MQWNMRNTLIMVGIGALSTVIAKAAQWVIGDVKTLIG